MDSEQKSTCIGVTNVIDSHIKSRNTYGEALRDLEMIYRHAVERLENLRWFYELDKAPPPRRNDDR